MFDYWLYYFVLLLNIGKFLKAEVVSTQQWNDFKTEFDKHYETSEVEQQKIKVYQGNLDKISKHNEKFKKGEVSFEMGMNHFGDLTEEEFAATHLSKMQLNSNQISSDQDQKYGSIIKTLPPHSGSIPESKNWASEGAVTRVKNQGRCGSCWAFCVAAAIESHSFLKTGHLVSFSAQNLLDCVSDLYEGVTNSCKEGTFDYPFQYVAVNHGIDTDRSYPYEEKQGKCRYSAENRGATIKNYNQPQSYDEELLKGIVGVIGPVTCTFNAEKYFIQFYKSGIYSSTTCGKKPEDINHAALIVGYGVENNQLYWIVKNSWGDAWGENGYFRVNRGSNECGISVLNYYPTF